MVDGDLLIGLREINDSGHSGVARLESDDDGVEVYLYVAEEMAEGAAETAGCRARRSPRPRRRRRGDRGSPGRLTPRQPRKLRPPMPRRPLMPRPRLRRCPSISEISPSVRTRSKSLLADPIIWTNQDGVPHTATAEQREIMQSGAISPGTSFSQIFETPGEFAYFCEFHPEHAGTIIVQ